LPQENHLTSTIMLIILKLHCFSCVQMMVKSRFVYYSLFFVIGFGVFCTGARQEISSDKKLPDESTRIVQKVPPNHCRIVGTILSITGTLKTAQADDPLSKVPCLAVVRIDSILGYGSAFTDPLAVGNEISVLFQFTLSPTKDIFPTLQQHYPGLMVGSVLRADLEEIIADEQQKKTLQYSHIIYGYQLIKR